MHLTIKRRLAAGAAIVAVAAFGAGASYACDGGGGAARADAASFMSFKQHSFRHGVKHALLKVTAGYFGISKESLKAQLRDGKSLAQIAPAGKTADGLHDALMAAFKTRLDAAVADGKMSQATADAVLAKASDKVRMFVNAIWDTSWMRAKDVHFGYHR